MEHPVEWSVRISAEFETACTEIASASCDAIVAGWKWALERDPFRVGAGLTKERDDLRVVEALDPMSEVEYVAGVRIDHTTRVVELAWLEAMPKPQSEGEE